MKQTDIILIQRSANQEAALIVSNQNFSENSFLILPLSGEKMADGEQYYEISPSNLTNGQLLKKAFVKIQQPEKIEATAIIKKVASIKPHIYEEIDYLFRNFTQPL